MVQINISIVTNVIDVYLNNDFKTINEFKIDYNKIVLDE